MLAMDISPQTQQAIGITRRLGGDPRPLPGRSDIPAAGGVLRFAVGATLTHCTDASDCWIRAAATGNADGRRRIVLADPRFLAQPVTREELTGLERRGDRARSVAEGFLTAGFRAAGAGDSSFIPRTIDYSPETG